MARGDGERAERGRRRAEERGSACEEDEGRSVGSSRYSREEEQDDYSFGDHARTDDSGSHSVSRRPTRPPSPPLHHRVSPANRPSSTSTQHRSASKDLDVGVPLNNLGADAPSNDHSADTPSNDLDVDAPSILRVSEPNAYGIYDHRRDYEGLLPVALALEDTSLRTRTSNPKSRCKFRNIRNPTRRRTTRRRWRLSRRRCRTRNLASRRRARSSRRRRTSSLPRHRSSTPTPLLEARPTRLSTSTNSRRWRRMPTRSVSRRSWWRTTTDAWPSTGRQSYSPTHQRGESHASAIHLGLADRGASSLSSSSLLVLPTRGSPSRWHPQPSARSPPQKKLPRPSLVPSRGSTSSSPVVRLLLSALPHPLTSYPQRHLVELEQKPPVRLPSMARPSSCWRGGARPSALLVVIGDGALIIDRLKETKKAIEAESPGPKIRLLVLDLASLADRKSVV